MALNTLGKLLVTGLVGFMGVVSTGIVFIVSGVHGIGSETFKEFAREDSSYQLFYQMVSVAEIGVMPMGLAAFATSTVLTVYKAEWKYFVIPMIMPWIMPIWAMIAAKTLY